MVCSHNQCSYLKFQNGYGPSRHGDSPNGGGGGYRYGGSREGMGGGGLHGSAHGSPRHGQPNGFPTSNVVSNPDGFVYKVRLRVRVPILYHSNHNTTTVHLGAIQAYTPKFLAQFFCRGRH